MVSKKQQRLDEIEAMYDKEKTPYDDSLKATIFLITEFKQLTTKVRSLEIELTRLYDKAIEIHDELNKRENEFKRHKIDTKKNKTNK